MVFINDLHEKIVLVTGHDGALGSVVSKIFADHGANVIGFEIDNSDRLDVTDSETVCKAVKDLITKYGRIDVLLNTVGIWSPQPRVFEMDDLTLEKLINTNLRSVFVMCRAVLPGMIDQRFGRIVNIGAKQGIKGSGGDAAYSVSKAGVISLTEAIADEVVEYGVTCNVVIPSIIDTNKNRENMPGANFNSWVNPIHIAETMAFLCGPNGGSINGVSIPIWNRS